MNNISVRINNTDTQDNANGLYIRILEADEITDIYNEHIVIFYFIACIQYSIFITKEITACIA